MSASGRTYSTAGGCHCGAISLQLTTSIPFEATVVRACQCDFCRKHAARTVSDPHGSVVFRIERPEHLGRYQFGLGLTDFLICRNCGVYVGAVMADGDQLYATVMVRALADMRAFVYPASPIDYGDETAERRRARRRARWTPARIEIATAGGKDGLQ